MTPARQFASAPAEIPVERPTKFGLVVNPTIRLVKASGVGGRWPRRVYEALENCRLPWFHRDGHARA
jgi:hypothetical protein